jgi:hypothetical protein
MRHHRQRTENAALAGSRCWNAGLNRLKTALAGMMPRPAAQSGRTSDPGHGHSELLRQMNLLEARIRGLEDRPRVPVRGEMSLNLTSRSMALKLARNGEDARHIARTLGIPWGEVLLLLKVHRLRTRTALQDPALATAPGSAGRAPGSEGSGEREARRNPVETLVNQEEKR